MGLELGGYSSVQCAHSLSLPCPEGSSVGTAAKVNLVLFTRAGQAHPASISCGPSLKLLLPSCALRFVFTSWHCHAPGTSLAHCLNVLSFEPSYSPRVLL